MSTTQTEQVGGSDSSGLIHADASMLSIPSRLEWVGKTADFLKNRSISSGACSPERADKLSLALYEAITNAIVHGNLGVPSSLKEESCGAFARELAARSSDPDLADRRVTVRYYFDGTRCTIAITDQGEGFDVQKWIKSQERDPDPQQPILASGRGILMMQALVDQVTFRSGGREVELSFSPDLDSPTGGSEWSASGRKAGAPVDGGVLSSGSSAALLLEQLRQPKDDPRRQHPRVAFTTSVEIRVVGGTFQTAFSRDLSRGGIAVVAPFELPVGPVELIVPIPGRDNQIIQARLVRCQRAATGVYDMGCQFL